MTFSDEKGELIRQRPFKPQKSWRRCAKSIAPDSLGVLAMSTHALRHRRRFAAQSADRTGLTRYFSSI
jgi:hypothetical protein